MRGKTSFIILVVFTLLLIALLLFLSEDPKRITIQSDKVNARKGPGLSYEAITSVHKGEIYTILSKKQDWVEIQLPDRQKGWVPAWTNETILSSAASYDLAKENEIHIRKIPPTSTASIGELYRQNLVSKISLQNSSLEVPRTINNRQTVISVETLFIRQNPSLTGTIIGTINKGKMFTVINQQEEWMEIHYKGASGWISSSYVQHVTTEYQGNQPSDHVLYGTVTINQLNIRDRAALSGNVISSVSYGEKLQIVADQNDWAKIILNNDQTGWVTKDYLEVAFYNQQRPTSFPTSIKHESAQILYNGTNIRSGPSLEHNIIQKVSAGNEYSIIQQVGEWYKLALSEGGEYGYVAEWMVSTQMTDSTPNQLPKENILAGKTILIDPGHGGIDSGTIGARGTFEKLITMKIAESLSNKLKQAGARAILTRKEDAYVTLQTRVNLSHYYEADAFLSLHFDSVDDSTIHGHTAYYFDKPQQKLALSINEHFTQASAIKNRGVQQGDYYVLRENNQPSVLLELGFLSHLHEEWIVHSTLFKERTTTGIYNGLVQFFQ
ncbi:SH3 domain-containing protein [Bacillus spongiae]|uniref:SH3 domain-containing protein n=1 Tax=Bacillus spongiae TaxID=2683610 RepID=A0ABU8H937_9BACI